VRAILSTKGSVCAFINSKYAKRPAAKGDIQISMKNVDFNKEYAKIPSEEKRSMAIRHVLPGKLARAKQPAGGSNLPPQALLAPTAAVKPAREKQHQTVMPEGIIIGVAIPGHCKDMNHLPPVRASLNSVGSVIAYMPAEESKRGFTHGRANIQLANVLFTTDLRNLRMKERVRAIKKRLLEGKEAEGDDVEVTG
jgi:hypothetical protein